ncbi:MAG: hypothetical protein WB609_06720 [Candidatus Cybelea sp.]
MVVSRVIDTGLILAAVYLGLSLIVSNINEQIAAVLKWRGKTLYSGVLNLLSGSTGLVEALFRHPLLASAQCDADGKPKSTEKYRPSYIGPRDFSLALWQSIATAQRPANPPPNAELDYVLNQATAAPTTIITNLQTQVALIPDANLRASLYALLGQCQGDYQKLLQVTDAWFNRQMDRVGGWYRRRSQSVVIVIAVLLVAILGVDTIRIAARLYTDDAMRNALTTSVARAIPTAGPSVSPAQPSSEQQQRFLLALDDPDFVRSFVSGPVVGASWSQGNVTFWGSDWIHFLGVLITIIALSLGAPFWFDALQFFSNTRLAGPKPQSSSTPSDTSSQSGSGATSS